MAHAGDGAVRTVRAPLRITFGGGGSDLAFGGVCLAASIDRYVTVSVADTFDDEYVLHYSEAETARDPQEIRHRILRQVLVELEVPPMQVATSADLPAGTGLGSSGVFTVALLKALCPDLDRLALARLACRFDLGQQDQWSAVWGGVNVYDFATETVRPVLAEQRFRLYYTGLRHNAAEVLGGTVVSRGDALHQVAHMVEALESDSPWRIGDCLTAQWAAKLVRQPTRTHQWVDTLIRQGIDQGAYGGKLVGAGDGGFLLFATDHELDLGLREVRFGFDHEGVRCMSP